MKEIKSLMVMALAILFSGYMVAQGNIDVAASKLSWKGYKVTGQHEGTLNIKEGNLTMEEGKLTGGVITIDMTSLTVTDLEGKGKANLEGHLKSSDFFSTDEFGTATLNITKVVSRGPAGEYKIIGDLTIKGITNPIKFNVKTVDGMMQAKITIDRSEYNVRYGSGSFFDNLGDKTIYDEFDLKASIALK